jgi:hypothetical protein
MTTVPLCDVCGVALSTRAQPCPACGHVYRPSPSVPTSQQTARGDELQPGFLLRKRYRIQQKVGEGGFGLVYKAWDEQKKRQVAIKQITLAALSAREMIQVTDSYNRETTLLPKLRHKSLPELYHQFTDPGHWYLAMQYINGQTLEERLMEAPQGRLPVDKVLSIGAALCDVLGYLHLQDPSIVFRDVKPANIMRASNGRIYLIDFGIARRYREGQRKDTGPLGSPGYAAPEQYGKAQSTPRTDMYGLGATLQTLLTGKEPWEIQATGIPADCDIADELQTLITQMLAPDPKQRPASMKQVGEALRRLQKTYPHSNPFDWVVALWMLLIMLIIPLLFIALIQLFYFFIAFVIVAVLTLKRLFKAKRAATSKLASKHVYEIIRDGLAASENWILGIYALAITYNMNTTMFTFNSKKFITFLAYIIIPVAGRVLMLKFWPLLHEKIKPKRAVQPSQQAVQAPPMEQEIHQQA